jgi:hypothetical protein
MLIQYHFLILVRQKDYTEYTPIAKSLFWSKREILPYTPLRSVKKTLPDEGFFEFLDGQTHSGVLQQGIESD